MDLLIALLRLLHIVMAFAWFGLGLVMTMFIIPSVLSSGESGQRFMKSLFLGTSVAKLFPIVSGTTTLAGILLYLTGSMSRFTTLGGIVLGIGALAGLAATIHGGAVTGKKTAAYAQALAQNVPDNGSLSADRLGALRNQATELAADSRISFILMVVALIGMGSARYL
jgi:hypothetical protein